MLIRPVSSARPGYASSPDTDVSEVEILGYRLRVIAPPGILDELRRYVAVPTGCFDAGAPGYETTIRVGPHEQAPGCQVIELDGATLRVLPRDAVVRYLEWLIHSVAIRRLGRRYLLLHAGAVAFRNAGLVLCAGSGNGKSTLTAGLIANGFDYLSDEIAAIDPATRLMHPYPRSICVKAGSRPALESFYPQLALDAPLRRSDGEAVWYLQPARARWRMEPVPVRYVVFPTYRPGAVTELAEISRMDAFERIRGQSFSGSKRGDRSVGAIVELLQHAGCYSMTVGALHEGIGTVCQLVADS